MPDPPHPQAAAVAAAGGGAVVAAADVYSTARCCGMNVVWCCPPDIAALDKKSSAYKAWYARQYKRKRLSTARLGDEGALVAIQQDKTVKRMWQKDNRRATRQAQQHMGEELRQFFLEHPVWIGDALGGVAVAVGVRGISEDVD